MITVPVIGIALAAAGAFQPPLAQPSSNLRPEASCIEADILFVADWSESLLDNEYFVVSAIQDCFDSLDIADNGIRMGIVTFSEYARLHQPITGNRSVLKHSIYALSEKSASGGTLFHPPFVEARQEFKRSAENRGKQVLKLLVFISDGKVYSPSDQFDALAVADELKAEGVYIYSILVLCKETDPALMQQISTGNGFFFTARYSELISVVRKLEKCL